VSDWTGWAEDVLTAGKWPVTAANIRFLEEWHPYEKSSCANNPLNTTEPWAGATLCNSAGVKNYSSQASGAAATAATLTGPFYVALAPALASGDPYSYPNARGIAQDIRTWGTPNYATFFLTQVGGGVSGATTGPTFSSTGTGPASSSHEVDQAWSRFMRTLAITVPAHLDRVAAARARIRAAVR
jgi:hypothetical protein